MKIITQNKFSYIAPWPRTGFIEPINRYKQKINFQLPYLCNSYISPILKTFFFTSPV